MKGREMNECELLSRFQGMNTEGLGVAWFLYSTLLTYRHFPCLPTTVISSLALVYYPFPCSDCVWSRCTCGPTKGSCGIK